MNIKKDILWRAYLAFFLVLLLAGAIIWKVGKIQMANGEHWRQIADSLTTTYATIESTRGNIYSDDGSLMATSLPIYEIRLDLNAKGLTDKVFYNKIDSLSLRLSQYFGDRSAYQYKRLLKRKRKAGARYFLLKRNINHNELETIKEFPIFRRGRYKGGFIAKEESKRIKPFGNLASRTLGYKIKNVNGVGLEGAFDKFLSGESGKRLMQKVRGGEWIPINNKNELEPKDGKDVISTLDVNIQDVTENALLETLKKHEAAHGCAVVMEVETGHIKAMANLERNKNGTYTENYNYAVGESLEPGSTFKIASAIALLENGYISPEDTINTGDGQYKFYGNKMEDAKPGGYGKITFHRAMEISSNVAFSKAVFQNYKDNPNRYIKELKALKLHKPLNLPIKGEGHPVIKEPSDEDWSGTTLPWMSIGYEVRLTPLQVLTLYNGLANNGKMLKPLFVKEVREVGQTVRTFKADIVKEKMCSRNTVDQITDMLKGVVKNGTGKSLRTNAYQIAGKTGTAKIASGTGGYAGEHNYQASFVGFFPADDPKYSCIVAVNKPAKGLYYGAKVAGPVFREITDKIYANNLKMQPFFTEKVKKKKKALPSIAKAHANDLKTICNTLNLPCEKDKGIIDWANPGIDENQLHLSNQELRKNKVPNVQGMVIADALYLLENRGLKVQFEGNGRVVSQSVSPGTDADAFEKIQLTLN